jgi:hypothetical protein
MLFLVGLKLQPLLFDATLNGSDVVVKNAFEITFVSALRFHSILESIVFQQNIPVKKGLLSSFFVSYSKSRIVIDMM